MKPERLKDKISGVIVVKCYHCEITMWSTSENAFVDDKDRIICKSCLED